MTLLFIVAGIAAGSIAVALLIGLFLKAGEFLWGFSS
jgi:hypothetical protein